jgi:bacterioferritin-associated ferredoxin
MPAIQSTFCGYYGVEMKQHNLSCIHYAAFVRLDNNKKNKSCGIYATAREAAIARDKGLLCWHDLHPSSADKKSEKVEPLVLNYTNARDLPDPVGYTGIPLAEVLPSFKTCHLPHCGMKCLSTSFARHLKSHTGVFQQCGKCDFQTDRVKGFQDHLKSHQPKKILRTCTADHCTFETWSEHEFAKHVKKHTGVYVNCQECNAFVSDIKSELTEHRKMHSRGDANATNQYKAMDTCSVEHCTFKYHRFASEYNTALQHHRQTHSGQFQTCPHCERFTSDRTIFFKRHVQECMRGHMHPPPPPTEPQYHCHVEGCGFVHGTYWKVTQHEKGHTGDWKICTVCHAYETVREVLYMLVVLVV